MLVRDIRLWDGKTALLIDGGEDPPRRPPLHLQAAAGGYLRLMGPDGPLLWGLVSNELYDVFILRAKHAVVHALPPIRVDEAAHAPGKMGSNEFVEWWARRFSDLLCASASTPLAPGRRYLLAPNNFGVEWITRSASVEGLLEQRESFCFRWDHGARRVLLTRDASTADDGRVKMWRKRARENALPPLLVWWCRGLFAHVLLDGHDRAHAARLENMNPDIVVLADVVAHGSQDLAHHRQQALDQAALLENVVPATIKDRASAMNAVLRDGWDPRLEWDLATPGFPLEGGVEQWEGEVRGTEMETVLRHERGAATPTR